jgi:D-sedoheptulose 7-phosphate isomerase
VDASLIYAQQLLALGNSGDVIIGFSTSGNSKNICKLFMTARVLNIKTILFTGNNNGKAEAYSDYVIRVPETETYKIQELHLPIYHSLALIIEQKIFGV